MPAVGKSQRHQSGGSQKRSADPGNDKGRSHDRGSHRRHPAFGHGARQADENDHGAKEEHQRNKQWQAGHPQSETHQKKRSDQAPGRLSVGQHLAGIVRLGTLLEGLSKHILQMPAGHPEPDQHEDDHGPHALMGQVRVARVQIHPLRALQTDDAEDTPLNRSDDVKNPDGGGDVEVDEIEKADPGGTDPHIQTDTLAEQGQRNRARDLRKIGKIRLQSVDAQQNGREGKPHPHGFIREKRPADNPTLLFLNHPHGHLDQRIDQFFPIHPLLAEDDHAADHPHAEYQKETVPVDQRQHPGAPGNGNILGQPFEEIARDVFPLRHHPFGDVLVVQVVPAILRSGVIGGAHQTGNDELRKSHAGDTGAHHHHEVNRDQLGLVQGQGPADEGHQAAGQNHEKEKEERRRRAEIQGQIRPANHGRGVCVQVVDQKGEHGSQQNAPHGNAGRAPAGHLLGLPLHPGRRFPGLLCFSHLYLYLRISSRFCPTLMHHSLSSPPYETVELPAVTHLHHGTRPAALLHF